MCPPRRPAPGPRSITCSAWRMVSSSCSTTTSVLPLAPSAAKRLQQDAVVARVQPDGGLVQDVADAAQVGAQLRGEPNALRLAAGERGCAAVERQVAQAHLLEERKPRRELGEDVARDLLLAARELHVPGRNDGPLLWDARSCRRWTAPWKRTASASGLSRLPAHEGQASSSSSHETHESSTWSSVPVLRALVVPVDAGALQLHARAEARGAPAVLRVVREQARVEFREAASAGAAGALRGEDRSLRAGPSARQHLDHALAVLDRRGEGLPQRLLVRGATARISATGSSSVCSRKRSRRGQRSVDRYSPSTRRCDTPFDFAHLARSV